MFHAALLAASLFVGNIAIRVSADDGGHQTVSIPGGGGSVWRVDVDADSLGNKAVVTAITDSTTNRTQVYLSLNGGSNLLIGTWSDGTDFSDGTCPRVAMDNGHLMVVWNWDSSPIYYRSVFGTDPKAQVFDYANGAQSPSKAYHPFRVTPTQATQAAQYFFGDVCCDSSNRFSVAYCRAADGADLPCPVGVYVSGFTYNASSPNGVSNRYIESVVNNTQTSGSLDYIGVEIAAFNDGGCVVAYSDGSGTLDAQLFDVNGNGGAVFYCLIPNGSGGTEYVMGDWSRFTINSDRADTTGHAFIAAFDTATTCSYDFNYGGRDVAWYLSTTNTVTLQTAQNNPGSEGGTFYGGPAVSSPSSNLISYEVGPNQGPNPSSSDSLVLLVSRVNACSGGGGGGYYGATGP